MKMIGKQTIEEIRAASDIVDVVGSYIQLRKAGTGSFKALCPFHKEKTPSFNVNPQRQSFHCFGCGVGGDVFKFVQQYESVDFTTAVRMLAEKAGIKVQFDAADDGEAQAKDLLYRIHEELAQFYHRVLVESAPGEEARRYLANRDLGPEIIEQFLIGFAPNRYNTMATWAEKKGYTQAQLETAGVLSRSENSDEPYDRFRNRVMFPIRDDQGRVIAFSGRIMDAEAKAAKYVNSPETPLFRKGRVLYALDKAKRPILESRIAILCEGQIDVIRCHSAGITTAVAAQGTALTEDHARLIKRYADSVVLVMDADDAGQNSALRSSEILTAAGLSTSVVQLPAGEDPDSLIRKQGAAAIQALVAQAKPALDFQIDVLSAREDVRNQAGLMRVARAVLETIQRAPSAVQQDQMLREAAGRLRLSEDALRADLRKRSRRPERAAQEAEAVPAPAAPAHPADEIDLARLLVHHPECGDLVRAYLPPQHLTDADCRTIIGLALRADRNPAAPLLPDLAEASDECRRLAAEIESAGPKESASEKAPVEAAKDYVLRVWHRVLKERRQELARRRDAATGPERDLLDAECGELVVHIQRVGRAIPSGWDRAAPILELYAGGTAAPGP
jgi:DNA primase